MASIISRRRPDVSLKRRQARADGCRVQSVRAVFASFAHPPFMPCSECGASVAVATEADHVCDPERRLDFELFQLREEISGLSAEIGRYLASPEGRFEQWYADHDRRQRDGAPPDGPEG